MPVGDDKSLSDRPRLAPIPSVLDRARLAAMRAKLNEMEGEIKRVEGILAKREDDEVQQALD